jgi:hypothetical protein
VISWVAHPIAFILLWRVPRPSFAWVGVFRPHSTNPSCPDLSRCHLLARSKGSQIGTGSAAPPLFP